MELIEQIIQNLINGEEEHVAHLTAQAIEQGLKPGSILDQGLIAGMEIVSDRFKKHEIFLPEVLLAARAMQNGLDVLKPLLAQEGNARLGCVVIGTVQGDLHDIGKNLVAIMLKGAGLDVIDLGNDVPPERFVDVAQEKGASVIGLSALLTTTMTVMQRVVECVNERNLSGQIKVIVGGAPVSKDFAAEIGADAYGYDAANAVDRVKALIRG